MVHLLLAVIYLCFVSLGLPDSLLGSAWPSMYGQFHVPVSYAGMVSVIIAAGTVFSSLQSDRLTKAFGTSMVTVVSVAMTALDLFGFSASGSFWMLCLWAVPYGLGAGCVDAALNNYVALHYTSRHMSWLHCMWGVGASLGPYIMGYALVSGQGWRMGYRYIFFIQIILTAALILTLPCWKNSASMDSSGQEEEPGGKVLTLREIVKISGAKEAMGTFFCYCALEQTAGLWGSSYLVLHCGFQPEVAARFAGLFFIGITTGRAVSGFLTAFFNDAQMVRLGLLAAVAGIGAVIFPAGRLAPAGLVLLGLGCAPVYPCLMHAAPDYFGADKSQAIIGVQMASAYVGICLIPPLFGIIAQHVSIALFPVFLMLFLFAMGLAHEGLLRRCGGRKIKN